jgi:hypothetical protein
VLAAADGEAAEVDPGAALGAELTLERRQPGRLVLRDGPAEQVACAQLDGGEQRRHRQAN